MIVTVTVTVRNTNCNGSSNGNGGLCTCVIHLVHLLTVLCKRGMTKFGVFGERMRQWHIFLRLYSELNAALHIQLDDSSDTDRQTDCILACSRRSDSGGATRKDARSAERLEQANWI